jgi:hypothetical protein
LKAQNTSSFEAITVHHPQPDQANHSATILDQLYAHAARVEAQGASDKASPKKLPKARPFKVNLSLTEEKLDQLAPILDQLADGDRAPRNVVEAPRHKRRLAAIIANVTRADATGRACHYSRDEKTHRGKSIYNPKWLGARSLRDDIDLLIDAGLLESTIGDQGHPNKKDKARSTIRPTTLLRTLLSQHDIGIEHVVTCKPDYIAIVVKDQKKLVEYDLADPVIAKFAARLDAFNLFMEGINVSYIGEDGVRKKMPYTLLDRTFNSRDLQQGGRFANGWWQNVRKEFRPSIEIAEDPTTEIDYAGMHIRMIYQDRGIDYQDDPYQIPYLKQLAAEQGVAWKKVRAKIKKHTNTMLNHVGDFIPWEWDFYPLSGITYVQVTATIKEFHNQVEDAFFKGLGLECMRIESDVMEALMVRAVEAGIPILPIHDSVRVATQHEANVREWMMEEYKALVGFYPVLSL